MIIFDEDNFHWFETFTYFIFCDIFINELYKFALVYFVEFEVLWKVRVLLFWVLFIFIVSKLCRDLLGICADW